MTDSTSSFRWIVGGAALLALAYFPTLSAPFDFIDDGNLVYPAPAGTTLREHTELWWHRVTANVEHLGPFRPVLWAHWQVQANLFGADSQLWRLFRFAWCMLAAGMLLWLFRELGIPPVAALLAGAAAMWNPYRNEIWTSLTLSEGVVMPYALFALISARKASRSEQPLWWDVAGIACVLIALGCKNTFAAIVPAQIALRIWPEGTSLRDALRKHRWRVMLFALPLALPIGHFIYFKLNWHAGQYATHAPSATQLLRYLVCLKGAIGLDFLGVGIVLAAGVVWWRRANPARKGGGFSTVHPPPLRAGFAHSPALLCAALLLAAGIVVYLPLNIVSGRYAMPAVWGLDILLAVMLAALLKLPVGALRSSAVFAICAGLVIVLLVNVNRQERTANRARMLWQVVSHLESTAPEGATIAWISGDPSAGELGAEEGIHLQWHLTQRGRPDLRIALFDSTEQPLSRVELPPTADEPLFRVTATAIAPNRTWETDRSFTMVYQFGRKRYDCHVSRRLPSPRFADEETRAEVGRLFTEMVTPPEPADIWKLDCW
ncbi:MAG: hypothetical protein L0241_19705 [Planctomycetia bacterium]|nr:hypothetical protein [Planctomycetia bacterium]